MSEPTAPEAPQPPAPLSFERGLLALVMAALCLITMANVLVRYFTSISFAFTEEISVSLLVVMTLVGTATAFARDRHIAILFVAERFSPRGREALARASLAASALMFGLLAWYGARMAWDDFRFEVTSPALGAPQWLYSVWLPLLSAAIVLRLLVRLGRRVRGG